MDTNALKKVRPRHAKHLGLGSSFCGSTGLPLGNKPPHCVLCLSLVIGNQKAFWPVGRFRVQGGFKEMQTNRASAKCLLSAGTVCPSLAARHALGQVEIRIAHRDWVAIYRQRIAARLFFKLCCGRVQRMI